MISYEIEKNLFLQEFIYVLADSGLGERWPTPYVNNLERMLRNSNLVLVARELEETIGILRALTDYLYGHLLLIWL